VTHNFSFKVMLFLLLNLFVYLPSNKYVLSSTALKTPPAFAEQRRLLEMAKVGSLCFRLLKHLYYTRDAPQKTLHFLYKNGNISSCVVNFNGGTC